MKECNSTEITTLFSGSALRRLIIPLLIEQVLVVAVGMIDVMMISFAGEAAVSGVSLVDMIAVIMIDIFAALGTGGAVICSQMVGAGNREKARDVAGQLCVLCVLISSAATLACLCLRVPLLRLFFGSIEEDVMQSAVTYFTITALSYPFLALYNACAAVYRAAGDSRRGMMTSMWMNLINIAGNAVFIFVFHIEVAGVALATLISRVVAALMITRHMSSEKAPIRLPEWRKLRLERSMVRRILHIGVPNGLENGFFDLGRALVVSIIATFGTVQIAANAVANSLDSLGCLPGRAMNLAMLTVVGQLIGAGAIDQVRVYVKKLLRITYAMMITLNICILVPLPLIMKLYPGLSPEARDLTMLLVYIHNGFASLLWPLSFTLPNALRAAGDVRYTMTVSIVSMAVCRIALSVVLGSMLGLGALGVWYAMLVDWVVRITCFIVRFERGKWKTMKV